MIDKWHPGHAHGPMDRGALGCPGAHRCLLDLDLDLAEAVSPDVRRVARAAATATVLETEAGPLPVGRWLAWASAGPGMLVVDGVVCLGVRVGDRVCAELLGAGDLVAPPAPETDQLVACTESWRALTPARLALLDGSFAQRVRFWPEIDLALLRRSARRAHGLDVQRAISAQPRLEVRLALLLWHLAGRWGRVERGGVRLSLPLTHQLLGQMVAAERPSVSHALARLAHAGLITGQGDEWHLHGELEAPWTQSAASLYGRAEAILDAVERSRRARGAISA